MKMKNILKQCCFWTLIGFIGIVVSSCDDEQRYGGEGETMEIMINMSTEYSNVDSRAVFYNNETTDARDEIEPGISINTVTCCLLLIYNGIGNDAVLLEKIDILAPGSMFPLKRVIPAPADGQTYRAIMLGNVKAEQLEKAAVPGAKLKDLNDYAYEIKSTYNDPQNNSTPEEFTWSGMLDYTSETTTLSFVLNPNMAKIKVTVTDSSSESNVVKVRVRHVPNKVRFAQNALSKGENFVDGTIDDVTYIDYDIESLDLAEQKANQDNNTGSATIYWYLPHNEAGNGDRSTDPVDAPENATWVEFNGIRTVDFLYTDYRIYPGKDEAGVTSYTKLKNFNVIAGSQYRLNVKITNSGVTFQTSTNLNDPSASAAINRVKLPSNSNSYMIHPLGSRSGDGTVEKGTLYELPINRINEYWGNASYGNNPSMTIGDTDEWVAEVIWQDIEGEQAIYFLDENGTADNDTYSGTGVKPIYFKLANQTPSNTTQTYGNVLIGVRKKTETTYLWSWHLWITDYNPDAATPYSSTSGLYESAKENKFIDFQGVYYSNSTFIDDLTSSKVGVYIDIEADYNITYMTTPDVGDANVQHYSSRNSSYWTATSKNYWDNRGWIMDRNLGSQGPGSMHVEEALDGWGLYYQFGRKDPFSYRPIYDVTGRKPIHSGNVGVNWEIKTIEKDGLHEGIKNPNTFYLSGNTWVGSSEPNSNIWYHPVSIADGEKSIFDPCPPGWCVPDCDAFNFLTKSSSTTKLTSSTSTSAHNMFYIYMDMCGKIQLPYSSANYHNFTGIGNLRDGHRHQAEFICSGLVNGKHTTCYVVFPLQGYISGDAPTSAGGGLMKNILSDNVPIASNATLARGLLWCAKDGEMIQMQPASAHPSGATAAPRHAFSRCRLVEHYYGTIYDSYKWKKARGHNIRCIQAKNDTPKFYYVDEEQ